VAAVLDSGAVMFVPGIVMVQFNPVYSVLI